MDLVILTQVLIGLTAALLIAAILSTISSVKLKRATDKLSMIQLSLASASLSRTLQIPKEWLTKNMEALKDTLDKVFPQRRIFNALTKRVSPEELSKLEQVTLPIKWSLDEDKLIITFPINFASRILNLLLINAREPDKIKELFYQSPLTALSMKEKVA